MKSKNTLKGVLVAAYLIAFPIAFFFGWNRGFVDGSMGERCLVQAQMYELTDPRVIETCTSVDTQSWMFRVRLFFMQATNAPSKQEQTENGVEI